MAARKLQTEIERTLKKVGEGVEIFESIFDKIQTSTNQTQKEKLEVDLKSQIKKLQRLRDQIKTWMQSNDIKDKQSLMDNRKLIETQMERFKACEKEMKTKAFSKEGLSAQAKLDPKEQLKMELCSWVTTMVDELARQIEQTEAEVEQLQLAKKKKDTEKEARLDELETLNERRSWHVGRLELILRLLENGNLQVDSVAEAKDDIAYFVESNTEEDFEEDEGIYDELNLEEEEDAYGLNKDDDVLSSHDDSASVADEPSSVPPTPATVSAPLFSPPPRTPAKEASKDVEKSPTQTKSRGAGAPSPTASRKLTLDSTSQRPNLGQTPGRAPPAPITVNSPIPPVRSAPVAVALPPIRYAAAAAGANATPAPPPSLPPNPPPAPAPVAAPVSLPPTVPSAPSVPAPASVATTAESRQASTLSSPEMSKASVPSGTDMSSAGAPSPRFAPVAASPALSAASVNGAYSNGQSSVPSIAASTHSHVVESPTPSANSLPHPATESAQTTNASASEPRLPSSLADLVTSFESAKQKSMRRDNDLTSIHKILDAGFSNVPQPLDAEKPKYYVARNPFQTPGYYPQEPSSQFANPQLFGKFDVDTLFYIFYYCQGTYLQFLAASELKKQSWRFHKQYLTWFQRANEPQQITDEYEQGVYLYFDWEGSWCQRRKSDFKFEYRYLET